MLNALFGNETKNNDIKLVQMINGKGSKLVIFYMLSYIYT